MPSYFSDGQLDSILRVGSCRLCRKKGGLFGWGSMMVAEMNDVQLDVHLRPAPETQAGPAGTESARVINRLKDLPRYLRWTSVNDLNVQRITIRMEDQGNPVRVIQAARLSPLPKGQFLLERNVVLTADGGRRRLSSDQAVWWPDLEMYAVKGNYSLSSDGEVQNGRHTLFHSDLEPITNNEEIAEYEQRVLRTNPRQDRD